MQLHDANKHRYILDAGSRQPAGNQELCVYKAARVGSSQPCENVRYGFQTFASF